MVNSKRKTVLWQKAYDEIKKEIGNGHIASGELLSESDLAERLEMSRTPVREALRMLSSEGLLEIKNGVGAYVKPLSKEDMEELYEVRNILEVQAIKTAVYHISNEEIARFLTTFQTLYDQCEQGNYPEEGEFSELDWELHNMFIERCTNKYIRSIVASNTTNLRRCQSMSAHALNDVKESSRQHIELLKVIQTRDPVKASEALKQHLLWSVGLLTIDRGFHG